jgi:photosystem II stability/assembly factor-like uncharacterized protein
MAAITPPPPDHLGGLRGPDELEALIEEARRHARRRRRRYGAALIGVALAAAGLYVGLAGGGGRAPASRTGLSPHSGSGQPAAARQSRAVLTGVFALPKGAFSVATGRGAAWVATGDGLLRVDPRTDRIVAPLSPPGAGLDEVAFGAGSLWVRSEGGILRVSPIGGRVLATVPIRAAVMVFGQGALWATAFAGGRFSLVRIDPGTDRATVTALPAGKVYGLAAGQEAVWVSAAGGGCGSCLLRVDPRSGRVVARISGADLFGSVAVGDRAVWVSDGASIVRVEPRSDRIVATLALGGEASAGADEPIVYGSGLLAAAPGIVWATEATGTERARVVAIDPGTDTIVGAPLPLAPAPESIAAVGHTVWVVSMKDVLTRIDLVACAPGPCRPPAPAPTQPAPFTPVWFGSLQMLSPDVGWALRSTDNPGVLDRAVLAPARTSDGGRTWSDVTPPTARRLLSPTQSSGTLFALDAEHAWFVVSLSRGRRSRAVVFATTDGGHTWTRTAAFDSLGSSEWITFVDPRHGWLMSDLGAAMGSHAVALYATGDGGRDWSLVARTRSLVAPGSGIGGLPVFCDKSAIRFATPTVGWMTGGCTAGGPYVESTRDGGRTWTAPSLPIPKSACASDGCQASKPQFFGATGFLVVSGASHPFLLVTRDRGASWSRAALPATTGTFPQIQFVDARHGFLVPAGAQGSRAGRLYRTSDAGRTWTAVLPNQHLDELGITFDFADPATGVAWIPGGDATSGVPPLYRTSDSGKTWERLNPRVTQTR